MLVTSMVDLWAVCAGKRKREVLKIDTKWWMLKRLQMWTKLSSLMEEFRSVHTTGLSSLQACPHYNLEVNSIHLMRTDRVRTSQKSMRIRPNAHWFVCGFRGCHMTKSNLTCIYFTLITQLRAVGQLKVREHWWTNVWGQADVESQLEGVAKTE